MPTRIVNFSRIRRKHEAEGRADSAAGQMGNTMDNQKRGCGAKQYIQIEIKPKRQGRFVKKKKQLKPEHVTVCPVYSAAAHEALKKKKNTTFSRYI